MLKQCFLIILCMTISISACWSQEMKIRRYKNPDVVISFDDIENIQLVDCQRAQEEETCCEIGLDVSIDQCEQIAHISLRLDSCSMINYSVSILDVDGNVMQTYYNVPTFSYACSNVNGEIIGILAKTDCSRNNDGDPEDHDIDFVEVAFLGQTELGLETEIQCLCDTGGTPYYVVACTSTSKGAFDPASGLVWSLQGIGMASAETQFTASGVGETSYFEVPLGSYSVTLSSYDFSGCNSMIQKLLDVTDECSTHFKVAKFEYCDRKQTTVPVTITNDSRGSCNPARTWLWDFGDGTTSIEQNPGSHSYPVSFPLSSTFTISLTMTDPDCAVSPVTFDTTFTIEYTAYSIVATVCANGKLDASVVPLSGVKSVDWDIPTSTKADWPFNWFWDAWELAINNITCHRWYLQGGPKNLSATIHMENGNECTVSTTVNVPDPLVLLVKYAEAHDYFYLNPNNSDDRLKVKNTFYLGFLHTKAVAQHRGMFNIWWRTRFEEIGLRYDGYLYPTLAGCPDVNGAVLPCNFDSGIRQNVRKITKWEYPGMSYWLGVSTIKSYFYAKQGSEMTGVSPLNILENYTGSNFKRN